MTLLRPRRRIPENERSLADHRSALTTGFINPGLHWLPSGGRAVRGGEVKSLTIEHVPRGAPPEWLVEYAVSQSLDVQPPESGGPPRLLVVHPSSAALEEFLDRVAERCPVVDRSSQMTLGGLALKLHADLRQPRLLGRGGATSLALDAVMGSIAKDLGFPILHPLPEMEWSRGKSAILLEMHAALQSEAAFDRFDGPGSIGVERAIVQVEKALRGRHPDRMLPVLCDLLEEAEEAPFTLRTVSGLVLLDRAPGSPAIEARLISALRRHLPIHQLCHAGSHRLGHHGWTSEDLRPIPPQDRPDWLVRAGVDVGLVASSDEVPSGVIEGLAPSVHRVLLQRSNHSIPVAARLLSSHLSTGGSALIIDPRLESRRNRWATALASLGVVVGRGEQPLRSSPFVHWIERFASLGHGESAFDLELLRGLSVQRVMKPFDAGALPQHPTEPNWRPVPDVETLERLAREYHLLAGPGALLRWLQAFARQVDPDDRGAARRERCQWWFLNLAQSLHPLLRPEDRAEINRDEFQIGCVSRQPLPLPEPAADGDAWLHGLLPMIDRRQLVRRFDGDEDTAMSGLQRLLASVASNRTDQAALAIPAPTEGGAWVEELMALIQDGTLPPDAPPDGAVRLLTPADALGCTADLVVIAHIEGDSWSMRVPKVPLLDEEERTRLDVNRPDGPVRAARHHIAHLFAAGGETIVLDTSLDESAPPAAPIAEWIRTLPKDNDEDRAAPSALDPDAIATQGEAPAGQGWAWRTVDGRTHVCALVHETDLEMDAGGPRIVNHVHGIEPRDERQRDGITLSAGRTPVRAPLSVSALSAPGERSLMADRIARQPRLVPTDEVYQSSSETNRMVTVDSMRLIPKKNDPQGSIAPRNAVPWPPIGGKLEGGQSMTIDPRPLTPHFVGLEVHDERSGAGPDFEGEDDTWSPSGLRTWMTCPRRGWLNRRLRAGDDETLTESLDHRVRGTLIHNVLEALICRALGMTTHEERTSYLPSSLYAAAGDTEDWMAWALEALALHAPWLERRDVTSEWRLRDLTGMSNAEWLAWLATSADPLPLAGRLGAMIAGEEKVADAAVIAIEWSLATAGSPVLIDLPGSSLPPIEVNGWIDRVDLAPFDTNGEVFVDEEGDESVAPIGGAGQWGATFVPPPLFRESAKEDDEESEHGDGDEGYGGATSEGWRPRRLVLIRDIKTKDESSGGSQHSKSLFEDVQLAIYARAWEVTHPGDLVVGVGVSEIGPKTEHKVEIDHRWREILSRHRLGDLTSQLNHMHRMPNEGPTDPTSAPFRAWLAHRLHIALSVAAGAVDGSVHATPGTWCDYCDVAAACGLKGLIGGWGN